MNMQELSERDRRLKIIPDISERCIRIAEFFGEG
jgi:hypothetical protein